MNGFLKKLKLRYTMKKTFVLHCKIILDIYHSLGTMSRICWCKFSISI